MHPDPTTPENTTLAALGLGKPLASTALPDQQTTARGVQDAAALTWLAVADLQPAPESIWQGIQSQVAPPAASSFGHRRWQLPLTYGGWATAAALALGWWLQDAPPATAPDYQATASQDSKPKPAAIGKTPTRTSIEPIRQEDAILRRELLQLRQRLADATRHLEIPGLHRPAIVELRAPGQSDAPAAVSDTASRLHQLVTRALQRDLILRDSANGPDIVLERGWPTANLLPTDSGQSIRHLTFPANRWEELGLWKSPDLFYDPVTSLTWAPAPDGLGYLGSVTPSPPNPSGFTKPRPKAELTETPAEPKFQAKPSGYLVSEPGSGDATLLLSDLPPVPEGGQQFVIASNANGTTRQYQISGPAVAGSHPITNSSSNTSFSSDSLTLSSLSLSGNYTSFQVVQLATDRSPPNVILTSGQP